VGYTSTSIVIAADGLVTDEGVPIGRSSKLMPLGNTGVCFIGGDSAIWTPDKNGGLDKLDYEKTIRDWTKANPTVPLPKAHELIGANLLVLMKAYRRRHPLAYPKSNTSFSYFVCVGYYMGLQQFHVSFYRATADDIASASDSPHIAVGRFKLSGEQKVCAPITKGDATIKLSQFRSDPGVVKYQKALAADNCSSISTDELLHLSRVCLEATESVAGREFDPDAKRVGPPNRYAVIDQKEGFKWVNPR
jgi:hypothetical protein